VTTSLADFVEDLIDLGELQVQLAQRDGREALSRARAPALFFATGLAVGLSGVPILLYGLAELLVTWSVLPRWADFIVVGVLAVVYGGSVAALAASRLGHCLECFKGTQEELKRNRAWARTVMAQSGRPHTHHAAAAPSD
jgi:hypothetical protein